MIFIENVMRCEQARQLFDAYLDGELSSSLSTELGVHRLNCPDCRRALALLEVSGHIIASDRKSVAMRADFADRLLACMKSPHLRWVNGLRRALYIAGPVAAAAVVVLAFLGFFDRPNTHVAGEKSVQVEPWAVEEARPLPGRSAEEHSPEGGDSAGAVEERWLEEWVEQTQNNIAAKRESGKSLQKVLDLTILQLLDILNEADDPNRSVQYPGSSGNGSDEARQTPDERGPGMRPASLGGDEVEDL